MDYAEEYGGLVKTELEAALVELCELLEEVREERELVLGQSGHHIASTKLFNRYRRELADIEARIEAIRGFMQKA